MYFRAGDQSTINPPKNYFCYKVFKPRAHTPYKAYPGKAAASLTKGACERWSPWAGCKKEKKEKRGK